MTLRTILWSLPALTFVAFIAAAFAGYPLPYLALAALGLLP